MHLTLANFYYYAMSESNSRTQPKNLSSWHKNKIDSLKEILESLVLLFDRQKLPRNNYLLEVKDYLIAVLVALYEVLDDT